jgi:DNA-binding FadR family transcriptional regulator
MKSRNKKPTLDAAAAHLRAMSLSLSTGEMLGSEEKLIEQVGVSRVTLRQAARLLEREGVLQVRRGANGGYFSARPDTQTIEGVFGAYLEALQPNMEDLFIAGLALWLEAVREATRLRNAESRAAAQRLRKRLEALPTELPIVDVLSFEDEYRRTIFNLVKRPYLELVFQLTRDVTRRHMEASPWEDRASASHQAFLRTWREIKLVELAAIEQGSEELTISAANRDRAIWQSRLFGAPNAAVQSSPGRAIKD